MAPTAYDMSNHDAEEHLKEGGTFEAVGGALKVGYVERFDRYVLVNDTGNGGDYIQPRYSTMQDLMEQLTNGSLAAWEAKKQDK